jgi:hypothetical protein
MKEAILVLQYPDSHRTVALAATKNPFVLRLFKETVLEDARVAVRERDEDDLLLIQDELELLRLQKLLDYLVPS